MYINLSDMKYDKNISIGYQEAKKASVLRHTRENERDVIYIAQAAAANKNERLSNNKSKESEKNNNNIDATQHHHYYYLYRI